MAKKNWSSKKDKELEEVNEAQSQKIERIIDKLNAKSELIAELTEVNEKLYEVINWNNALLTTLMSDLKYVNFGMHNPLYLEVDKVRQTKLDDLHKKFETIINNHKLDDIVIKEDSND